MIQTNQNHQEPGETHFQIGTITRNNGFRMEGYWIWCPSIVFAEGKYHMFASRWPKTLPFNPGWIFASEVVRATAEHPEGPYTFAEVILPARGPEYWDGCVTHNPTIREYNGRFYLFYTGTRHPFPPITSPSDFSDTKYLVAQSNKRVGLAWADSINGPWHRMDTPILPTEPATYYSWQTTNPAPVIEQNGKTTLLFKCRAYRGYERSGMQIGVAEASSPEAPFRVVEEKPIFTEKDELEDPFLWHDGQQFRMIAKKMHGRTEAENGELICAHSKNARQWDLEKPAVAFRRNVDWEDGTTGSFAHMERPFGFVQNDQLTHICVAACNGLYGFRNMTESRNLVLPVTEPLSRTT